MGFILKRAPYFNTNPVLKKNIFILDNGEKQIYICITATIFSVFYVSYIQHMAVLVIELFWDGKKQI